MTAAAPPKCPPLLLLALALAVPVAAPAQENPLARAPSTAIPIEGRWNGADLERRSNCSQPQNNGSRGTYAEFVISTNTDGDIGIAQTGITGLTCSYFGKYRADGAGRSATGSYTCSDGKRGDFATRGILVTETAVSIRMDIVLNTTETCTVDAVIGGSRFFP